jgi:hypothetical protein
MANAKPVHAKTESFKDIERDIEKNVPAPAAEAPAPATPTHADPVVQALLEQVAALQAQLARQSGAVSREPFKPREPRHYVMEDGTKVTDY